MRKVSRSALFTAVAVAVSTGSPAAAQQPAGAPVPTRSYVQVIRLKPDMVTQWLELQKNEVIPAQKKAGVASRTTLVTVVGNTFEYVLITPFPSWAAFDSPPPLTRALGAEGAAALNAKLRQCIMTQTSYMANRVDSLAIPAGDAAVWRYAVRRMIPGKTQEYLAFYKNEVLPGLQKAKAAGKIAGATIGIRGAGAPTGEFTTITFYSTFAEIDAGDPLIAALGRDAADKINAKSTTFATNTQVILRRRLPDLSF